MWERVKLDRLSERDLRLVLSLLLFLHLHLAEETKVKSVI